MPTESPGDLVGHVRKTLAAHHQDGAGLLAQSLASFSARAARGGCLFGPGDLQGLQRLWLAPGQGPRSEGHAPD